MKFNPLFTILAALLALVPCSRAAETAPAPAPAANSGAEAKLNDLVARITAKIETGKQTEADFTKEIAEFATLASGQKPDDAAMIMLMKARLYLEVFQDSDKGIAALKQIVADYPTAEVVAKIKPGIVAMEQQAAAAAALAVGNDFPALGEADTAGKPIDLSSYAGKVVLVDFWATWCGPCVAELPNVIAAYEKYHGKGFEIIGISLDKNRGALDDFLKKHNMPWRQYFDGLGWENKISTRFGISSIPATFLIDGKGKIIAKDLRGKELEEKLTTLLAK